MNTDIRISVDFPAHHKTLKLIRRLGDSAPWALVRLWLYVAKHCPDGVLSGMDHEDIEIAAGWNGEEGTFVPALVDIRWLDLTDDVLSCHDWAEHNPWAANADERSDIGRFNRLKQVNGVKYRELKANGVTAISKSEYEEFRHPQGTPKGYPKNNEAPLGVQLAPAPAPAPEPKSKEKEKSLQGASERSDFDQVDLTENQLRVLEALKRQEAFLRSKFPLVDFELEKQRLLEKARASPILDAGQFVLSWFQRVKPVVGVIADVAAHNQRVVAAIMQEVSRAAV